MKKLPLFLVLMLFFFSLHAQSPQAFNYQAIARDSNGNALSHEQIQLKLSLKTDLTKENTVYSEIHDVTTQESGLVNILVGLQNTIDFQDINWSEGPFFIEIEIDGIVISTTQLLSVPFALYANEAVKALDDPWENIGNHIISHNAVQVGTHQSDALFSVGANDSDLDIALFELRNNQGELVFAVYKDRVELEFDATKADDKSRGGFVVSGRTAGKEELKDILHVSSHGTQIFVDETNTSRGGFAVSGRIIGKDVYTPLLDIGPLRTEFFIDKETSDKSRGGFAVSGRTTGKELVSEIFSISSFGTQIFVGQEWNNKSRGGFAVSGRTTGKDIADDLFRISPERTEVFVYEGFGKSRGGFAVSGRTTGKVQNDYIFHISTELTEFFINENNMNKSRGGFAISGRTTGKNNSEYSLLTIRPERSDFFLKPSPDKILPEGFSISAFNYLMEPIELFVVANQGTFVNTGFAVPPKVKSLDVDGITQTLAHVHAEVESYGGSSIQQRGMVYSQNPNPTLSPGLGSMNPAMGGIVLEQITGDGFGIYQTPLQWLIPGTAYHVRPIAINEDGLVGYGTSMSFTTDAPYSLSFEVRDAESEGNIDNAVITLNSEDNPFFQTQVNTIGDYAFDVAGGLYSFEVEAPGYNYGVGQILVEQDNTLHIEPLELIKSTVSFMVRDANDNPIQGATIHLYDDQMEFYFARNSNEQGLAVFYPIPGNYSFTIAAITFEDYEGDFSVEADEEKNISVALSAKLIPTLITQAVHSITQSSAVGGGNIISDGGADITQSGMVWSTDTEPDLENYTGMSIDQITNESFSSLMEDLQPATTYYCRAYGINDIGTAYGNQVQFTTLNPSGNIMKIRDLEAIAGQTITVEIEVFNEEEFTGFNVDIPLPQGFVFVDDSENLYRFDDHFVTLAIIEGNILRIISASANNVSFSGNSGLLLDFQLQTPDIPDSYVLELMDAVLGNQHMENIITETQNGNVILHQ